MSAPVILWVDRSSSKCGACGKGASTRELTHQTVLGWAPDQPPGCGARFTHIAAVCVFGGVYDVLARMRPDLTLITDAASVLAKPSEESGT
jgi:hypothetical protein